MYIKEYTEYSINPVASLLSISRWDAPIMLLIITSLLKGLILTLTLGTILIGANRKDIVGSAYEHPL